MLKLEIFESHAPKKQNALKRRWVGTSGTFSEQRKEKSQHAHLLSVLWTNAQSECSIVGQPYLNTVPLDSVVTQ